MVSRESHIRGRSGGGSSDGIFVYIWLVVFWFVCSGRCGDVVLMPTHVPHLAVVCCGGSESGVFRRLGGEALKFLFRGANADDTVSELQLLQC